MKLPNYLLKSFAFIGVLSTIILACSAVDDMEPNAPQTDLVQPTNNIGKYHTQIEKGVFLYQGIEFHVMTRTNTENGEVQTYGWRIDQQAPVWSPLSTLSLSPAE